MNFRSGELDFNLAAEDVPFAELLIEPLQVLNLKGDLKINGLGFSIDMAFAE